MSDLTFSEKVGDVIEKVSSLGKVLFNILPGGTFSFGTETVRGVPLRVFKQLPPALGKYYEQWFNVWADREWLVYEGQRITFRDARRMYEAIGAELCENPHFGVQHGDRVGIAMRNYPELLVSFLAITAAGGVAVPLNALWKSDELEYAVGDAACKVVIGDPERLALCVPFQAKQGFRTIVVRGAATGESAQATGAVTWDDVLAEGTKRVAANPRGPKQRLRAVKAEDEAMIMYTSGSTGFPKGVVHTQRSVGTAMKIGELAAKVKPDPDGVQLMAVPLFHITALCPIGLFSIPMGSKIIMMRKWDAGEALKIIPQERVTRFTGVPTMMMDLMQHPDWAPEKVETLRGVVAGGAPVPPSQVAEMRQKSKKIQSGQGYGLTEKMALGTVNQGADYLRHPTSCGRPVPLMVEIAILDPENNNAKVPDGQRGEVCIKGAMIMKGYNNLPEKTAEAIDENGYFHSGDIGKMEGGFVYILDRMKDLIIRGGENIDCSEVEAAIVSHDSVRECSVFGLPDARLGEVVGAAVWTTDAKATPEVLAAHAAKALAKFKVPDPQNIFIHTEQLPKGPTGKLDKKGLRTHYSDIVAKRPIQSKL